MCIPLRAVRPDRHMDFRSKRSSQRVLGTAGCADIVSSIDSGSEPLCPIYGATSLVITFRAALQNSAFALISVTEEYNFVRLPFAIL